MSADPVVVAGCACSPQACFRRDLAALKATELGAAK